MPLALNEKKLASEESLQEAEKLYHEACKVIKLVEGSEAKKDTIDVLHSFIFLSHHAWIMPLLDLADGSNANKLFTKDWPTMLMNASVHTLEDLAETATAMLDILFQDQEALNAQLDAWFRAFAASFRTARDGVKSAALDSLPAMTAGLNKLCDDFKLDAPSAQTRALADLDGKLVKLRTAAMEKLSNICPELSSSGPSFQCPGATLFAYAWNSVRFDRSCFLIPSRHI